MPSRAVENYVKTIYLITSRSGGVTVGNGELVSALGVSPGAVTGMLKTLSEGDLAVHTPYEGTRLTASGRLLALTVLRRHRLLELFLAQTLVMPWDEVHEEAEHLEHAVSERLVARIDAFLGYPTVDPHGDPIPRADGLFTEPDGLPLTQLAGGRQFRLIRVVDQVPAFLRYLSECGLNLGTVGELTENRPEAGAVVLKIGERGMALGRAAAGKLLVTPEGAGEALEAFHSLVAVQASLPSDASCESQDSSTNSESDARDKVLGPSLQAEADLTSSRKFGAT